MKRFDIIGFDCDGVMFDSKSANRRFYNMILAHFNRPEMTEAEFHNAHMFTVNDALAMLFGTKDDLARAQAFRKTLSYQQFLPFLIPEPTLVPTLTWLVENGFSNAVVTNRTDTMHPVLEAFSLTGFFKLVVTALDVPRPKPDPAPIIKVLNHFNLAPLRMLYVGDSELDQQAANAAGVPFAAFGNIALAADYHIDRLEMLKTIVFSSSR